MVALGELLVLPVAIFTTASADPRLLGALRKTVSPGGGMKELMKRIFPRFTPSRITLMESTRETVSLSRFVFFFCLVQETVRRSRYMI